MNNIVKERIKNHIKKNKLSIDSLCKQMKVNRNYFNQINSNTGLEKIERICNELNISIYDIVDDQQFQKYYNESGKLIKIERL